MTCLAERLKVIRHVLIADRKPVMKWGANIQGGTSNPESASPNRKES